MPYASLFNLQRYGPASGATVTGGAGAAALLRASGVARAGMVTSGVASAPLLKATRLVNSPLIVTGTGTMVQALPKARARAGLVVRVNELSQDDVTGAVLQAPLEGGLSVADALRVLLAVAAGKTDIVGTSPTVVTFRDQADTKDRVRAEMTGSERDAVTIDGGA